MSEEKLNENILNDEALEEVSGGIQKEISDSRFIDELDPDG